MIKILTTIFISLASIFGIHLTGMSFGSINVTVPQSPAAGYTLVGLSTGNYQATSTLYIKSNGNVGIGTTTPAGKLQVYGAPVANTGYGTLSLGGGVFGGGTGTFAGNASGTSLAVNEVSGYTGSLMDLQVNGVSQFKVGSAGQVTANNTINSGANVVIATGYGFISSSRGGMYIPANGTIALQNSAQTDFNLLQFGGTTSAFPAIKSFSTSTASSTALQVIGADGTSNVNLLISGNVGIGTTTPNNVLNVFTPDATLASGITVGNGFGSMVLGNNTANGGSFAPYWKTNSNGSTQPGMLFWGNGASGDDSGTVPLVYLRGSINGNVVSTRPIFGIYNSSTALMTIDKSGNVGIGTTSPLNTLSLYSATSATAGFSGGAAMGQWTMGYDVTNNRFAFASSSDIATNVKMVISNSGNVGIGTTGPTEVLHVVGNERLTGSWESTLDNQIGWNTYYSSGFKYRANGYASYFNVPSSNGGMSWFTASSGTAGAAASFTEKMHLSAAGGLSLGNAYIATDAGAGNMIITGNVGIGTTSPQRKLTVTNAGANGQLLLEDTAGASGNHYGVLGFSRGQFNFDTLSDAYASTSRMVIDKNGNVGIGTTGPGAKLEIAAASAAATGLKIGGIGDGQKALYITTASTDGSLYVENTYASYAGTLAKVTSARTDSSAFTLLSLDNASGNKVTVLGNGNVGIGTTSPAQKLDVAGDVIFGTGARTTIKDGTTYSNIWSSHPIYLSTGSATGYQLAINSTGLGVHTGAYSASNALDVGGAVAIGAGYTQASAVAAPANGMIIQGNVGIGTTTPSDKLDINGNSRLENQGQLRFEGLRANGSAYASLSATSTMTSNLNLTLPKTDGSNGNPLLTNGVGNLYFSNIFTALNGMLGIGTTTPSNIFSVMNEPLGTGAIATTTVDFGDYSTSTSHTCFNVQTTTGTNASFYFTTAGMVFETNRCK